MMNINQRNLWILNQHFCADFRIVLNINSNLYQPSFSGKNSCFEWRWFLTHLPTMIIYQRRPLGKLLAHKIVLEVLVHPSETFEYFSSVLAKSGPFQEYCSDISKVNEVNDILVIEKSDEILEDMNESPGCYDT